MVYDALSVKEERVTFFACTKYIWDYFKAEDQNNEFDILDQNPQLIWFIRIVKVFCLRPNI